MKINYNWSAHNFRLKPSAMSFSYILLVNVTVSKKKQKKTVCLILFFLVYLLTYLSPATALTQFYSSMPNVDQMRHSLFYLLNVDLLTSADDFSCILSVLPGVYKHEKHKETSCQAAHLHSCWGHMRLHRKHKPEVSLLISHLSQCALMSTGGKSSTFSNLTIFIPYVF